ncbi:MAG TPA: hypothetical protein VJK72_02345 [Candidatus Nanoarchaeia archaeon]|nr:hypothetical protein [Candidatus Nanoarchaeia archaeon]
MRRINIKDFHEKWALSLKVFLLIVLPGLFVQYYVRSKGWNILDMNIIIASLLTGAVFLIGFMLAGILQDFKDSEQLLGSIASGILSFQDHNRIEQNKKNRRALLVALVDLTETVKNWLENKAKVETVYAQVNGLNKHFAKFGIKESFSWMEETQKGLRQDIMRVHVIKETMFIKAGYTIMEIISAAVIVLIVFSKTDTFILGAATYAASSFILVYMILLIKDMDDPFEFTVNGAKKGAAEVSMIPLDETIKLLKKELG